LALTLAAPAPETGADPAILRQHAEALAELKEIREEARQWGATLERELPNLPTDYRAFAEDFRACLVAYEPWIARIAQPCSLPPTQLDVIWTEANEATRRLNISVRLRLAALHPVPAGGGAFPMVCLIAGIAAGLGFGNVPVVALGVGLALLAAYLSDLDPRRRSALQHQRRMEQLIEIG
jgi:hypothetical protein